MDLNRHQFLFIGLIVLMIGVQVRYVSAFVLNPKATQFLAEHTGQSSAATAGVFSPRRHRPGPRKMLQPPEWLSWCLISVGAVLVLHSLAMPKPVDIGSRLAIGRFQNWARNAFTADAGPSVRCDAASPPQEWPGFGAISGRQHLLPAIILVFRRSPAVPILAASRPRLLSY